MDVRARARAAWSHLTFGLQPGFVYGTSREWTWATPGSYGCPPGFTQSSWGCSRRNTGFGADNSGSRKGVWLGVAGLVLSAGIMIAMGFHKSPQSVPRRRRRST